jgi:hypothetical protein
MNYYTSSAKQSRTPSYRFSITDLNDPALAAIIANTKLQNAELRRSQKRRIAQGLLPAHDAQYGRYIGGYRVRVRPRGPRFGHGYDSRKSTATHFDVYVTVAEWKYQSSM